MAAVVAILTLSLTSAVLRGLDVTLADDTWKWVHKPKTFNYPAMALAVVTFLDAVRRIKWGRQAKLIATQKREIFKQLSSLVASLSEILGRPPGSIGCGLFLVDERRRLQRPWSGRRFQAPWRTDRTLVRVERVRLIDDIQESTVTFTKGKGVVGRCWEAEDTAHFDWTTMNRRHEDDESWRPTPNSAGWNGFSELEWRRMVGRYSGVLAVPVTKSQKFVGCVAVDYRWYPEDIDAEVPNLNARAVKQSVGGIARTMVGVLSGGAG